MTSNRGEDVIVRVGELRAVVGPPRRARWRQSGIQLNQPPGWLVLNTDSVAYGTFTLDADGELEHVRALNGKVPEEMLDALLEAGRHQWRRRRA